MILERIDKYLDLYGEIKSVFEAAEEENSEAMWRIAYVEIFILLKSELESTGFSMYDDLYTDPDNSEREDTMAAFESFTRCAERLMKIRQKIYEDTPECE